MKKLFLPLIIINTLYSETSYLEDVIESTNEYRKSMHQTLMGTAENIDNFFDASEYKLKKHNNTYGLIQLSAFYNKGSGIHFDQKVSIKLKLPKLKRKFKLLFESDEIRENIDFTEKHTINNNDNFNLSLLYENLLKEDLNFKSKLGIKLGSTLNPFIKANIKKTIEDIKGVNYTFSQAFKESVKDKLESTSYVRLDKQLSDIYSIHNYNEYYWKSTESKDSQLYSSIYLNQKLSSKDHISYTLGTNMNNIDSNLKIKRYSATLKYRHWLRKWIYIDTIPENYYNEDEGFDSNYSVKINLGIYINKKAYK